MIIGAVTSLLVALASATSPSPHYKPFVAANPVKGVCYGKVGLYVGLEATVHATSLTKLGKIAAANVPRVATVTVAGKTHRLTLDRKNSVFGNGEIGWNFKLVRLPATAARHLVSQRAVVRYRVRSRRVTVRVPHIADGRC
jgi:hypothetical protein